MQSNTPGGSGQVATPCNRLCCKPMLERNSVLRDSRLSEEIILICEPCGGSFYANDARRMALWLAWVDHKDYLVICDVCQVKAERAAEKRGTLGNS